MRILFTGITGLIGRYFLDCNPDPTKYSVMGTCASLSDGKKSLLASSLRDFGTCIALPFDKRTGYENLIKDFKPTVIVHAGGQGNVDFVEKNPDTALDTNLHFPLFLLELADKYKIRFVHFSSNAVYDGGFAPYKESSQANPINSYGKLKKKVDDATRTFPGEWMIIRPIVAYGWNFPFSRANPVSHFLPMLEAQKPLKMAEDVYENPVYADDVARVLWRCLISDYCGELNVAGGDQGINRFQWFRMVAEVFGCNPDLVEATSLKAFPGLAPRPVDTRFDISKLLKSLNYRPLTVREGLESMLRDTKRRGP